MPGIRQLEGRLDVLLPTLFLTCTQHLGTSRGSRSTSLVRLLTHSISVRFRMLKCRPKPLQLQPLLGNNLMSILGIETNSRELRLMLFDEVVVLLQLALKGLSEFQSGRDRGFVALDFLVESQ